VLTTGASRIAAEKYLTFLGSPAAKKILENFGYCVPKQ